MQGVENFIQYCQEHLEKQWQKIIKIASTEYPADALGDEYLINGLAHVPSSPKAPNHPVPANHFNKHESKATAQPSIQ